MLQHDRKPVRHVFTRLPEDERLQRHPLESTRWCCRETQSSRCRALADRGIEPFFLPPWLDIERLRGLEAWLARTTSLGNNGWLLGWLRSVLAVWIRPLVTPTPGRSAAGSLAGDLRRSRTTRRDSLTAAHFATGAMQVHLSRHLFTVVPSLRERRRYRES